MNLVEEIVNYYTRNGYPRIHKRFKDNKDNVIIEIDAMQQNDTVLVDEAAYDAIVTSLNQDAQATLDATNAQAALDAVALENLRMSGESNLIAGNPLTADEAYVITHQKLPMP